jgi:hypothetical protein
LAGSFFFRTITKAGASLALVRAGLSGRDSSHSSRRHYRDELHRLKVGSKAGTLEQQNARNQHKGNGRHD